MSCEHCKQAIPIETVIPGAGGVFSVHREDGDAYVAGFFMEHGQVHSAFTLSGYLFATQTAAEHMARSLADMSVDARCFVVCDQDTGEIVFAASRGVK